MKFEDETDATVGVSFHAAIGYLRMPPKSADERRNRIRASKACELCNQKRVKCDALTVGLPCTRCKRSGHDDCTLINSRRGQYPRKRAKTLSQSDATGDVASTVDGASLDGDDPRPPSASVSRLEVQQSVQPSAVSPDISRHEHLDELSPLSRNSTTTRDPDDLYPAVSVSASCARRLPSKRPTRQYSQTPSRPRTGLS